MLIFSFFNRFNAPKHRQETSNPNYKEFHGQADSLIVYIKCNTRKYVSLIIQ